MLGLLDEGWAFSQAQIRKLSVEEALKRPVNAGSPDLSLKLAQINEKVPLFLVSSDGHCTKEDL